MAKQQDEFGICLFGFNKEQVNKHIENTKRFNEEKLRELKEKLFNISRENERLSQELTELNMEMKFEMKSEEFMKFALKKAENLISLINKTANEEISKILVLGKQQEAVFNKKIEEYNNIMKNTQEHLNLLLISELKKNEDLSENVKNFIQEKALYNETINKELEFQKELEEVIHIEKEDIQQKGIIESNEKVNDQLNDEEDSKNALMEDDINLIRNRYLLGKIAGADLIDNKENIIINKNSVITWEVINKAEKEGKLAELIIAMTLPDME